MFDTVEGIILLLILLPLVIGKMSWCNREDVLALSVSWCCMFWKFCDEILMERETNAEGENRFWSWSFSSSAFYLWWLTECGTCLE